MPRDQNYVGFSLGYSGGNSADANLADQLHVNSSGTVGALKVEDQLLQVFDRVDVVVRRRRNQSDTGGGVSGAGNPRVNLVRRKLTTLARFGSLGHLDLDVVGVGQIHRCNTEASRGNLLDGRATSWVE